MKTAPFTAILSALCILAAIPITFAEDTNLTQSAWKPSPVQADPGLRDPLLQRGQEVFQARCNICHGAIPKEVIPGGIPPMPGTQALRARYNGKKPALLEQRRDLTPALITACVRKGIGSMPFFRPTEITDADLIALGAYLARKRP